MRLLRPGAKGATPRNDGRLIVVTETYSKGKTTVSPDVLVTIARLSALSVSGVSHMAQVPGGVNRLFKRGIGDGVRIEIKDNVVNANLYLILKPHVNIREVSRNVQHQVARALQEMVGMDIGGIEIHIEDIDMDEDPEATSA